MAAVPFEVLIMTVFAADSLAVVFERRVADVESGQNQTPAFTAEDTQHIVVQDILDKL